MSAWIAAGSSFAFTPSWCWSQWTAGRKRSNRAGDEPTQPAGVAQADPVVGGMRDSGRRLPECDSRRWLVASSSARPSQGPGAGEASSPDGVDADAGRMERHLRGIG